MGKIKAIITNILLWRSFFTTQIVAEDAPVYGLVNGEVMLTPESFSEKLVRILWKLGEDKAAEWEPDTLDYFRIFKGPASLNKATGTLTLTKLTTEFNGFYSAEINGKPSTKRTNLIVISRVSKPSIEKQCNESVCMLSCKPTKPTVEEHYTWMEGEKFMGNRDIDFKLVKSDEVLDKAYRCNYSNPLSYALSDDIVPFPSEGGSNTGAIVGGVFGSVGCLALAGIGIKHRKGRTSGNPGGNPEAGTEGATAEPMIRKGGTPENPGGNPKAGANGAAAGETSDIEETAS